LKDMSLANILIAKRREKGVTQDEFAAHVRVSKGSVSKWERGHTFPDIMLLPIIAEYFGITIDQLMCHSPQLSKAEAERIYTRLAESFAKKPFEDVVEECDTLVKRHYSCFIFVWYVALLYRSHAHLAATAERKSQIFQMAIDLCEHILQNCREPHILKSTMFFQASYYMQSGQPEKVIELLCDENQMPLQYSDGGVDYSISSSSLVASQAHRMLGNTEMAMEIEQVEMYCTLMTMLNSLLAYIRSNVEDYEVASLAYERAVNLAESFNMRRLYANNIQELYYWGARMYQAAGDSEKATHALGKYVDVCVNGYFPLTVRGDSFFSKIDSWVAKAGDTLMHNDTTIKKMMKEAMLDPAFDTLRESQEFVSLVEKLKTL